jgi:hypothetical protein
MNNFQILVWLIYSLCYQTMNIRFVILIMKIPSYNPKWRAGYTQILGLNIII